MKNFTFCFNLVGLSPALLDKLIAMPCFSKLMEQGQKANMIPVFPCLTLPGQASFSTGTYPSEHGIIANGLYCRDRFEVSFWDQYRSNVQATPLWEELKSKDLNCKTAVLFCQNTLYGGADMIITPKPMHTDEGLVQWCYSKPVGLYENVIADIGRPFNLMDYWGPFASAKASEWIMDAAMSVVKHHLPDFMMTYIPHLDYSCQKLGPDDPIITDELKVIDDLMASFIKTLEQEGIRENSTICFFSEYSISPVTGVVLLNTELRKAGFLNVREIASREYLDFEMSRAFAMVDHQIAHIYVKDAGDIEPVRNFVKKIEGVDQVLGAHEKEKLHIHHERSGELVAVSDPDKWFAYYWWQDQKKAPDFAENIDIHRKPGYDPVELFMNMETFKIPQAPELVKGSHGAPPRNGEGMAIFMVSGHRAKTIELPLVIDMVDGKSILEKIIKAV